MLVVLLVLVLLVFFSAQSWRCRKCARSEFASVPDPSLLSRQVATTESCPQTLGFVEHCSEHGARGCFRTGDIRGTDYSCIAWRSDLSLDATCMHALRRHDRQAADIARVLR